MLISSRLLVILSDRLSKIIEKGEITDRYYNPGNLFDDVTLLLTNDDSPSLTDLQRTAGTAKLTVINHPIPAFSNSFGWSTPFLKPWIEKGIRLAKTISPNMIRIHGNFENGFLAAKIKEALKIPLVVSLHINPDADMRPVSGWWSDWKHRFIMQRMKPFEKETLMASDWALPVYEPIRSYAEENGAHNIKVAYNFLNAAHLKEKTSYQLSRPAKLISVGRQLKEKNPADIMRAVAALPAHLTLIGDGPYHDKLRRLADALGGENKFHFIKALTNDALCSSLTNFDLFVVHTQYYEFNKSVIEALLTGLPVILNRRKGNPVSELNGDWVHLVDDNQDAYFKAIKFFIENNHERERLGRRAFEHSRKLYSPEKTEAVYIDVYRRLLESVNAPR